MLKEWFMYCPNGHQLQLIHVLRRDVISGKLYFKCPACIEQISAEMVLQKAHYELGRATPRTE